MSQPEQSEAADGADEADHDALEQALTVLLVALLIAWLVPGPFSLLGNARRLRRSQLLAVIGDTLQSFILRTSYDLSAAAGQPGSTAAMSAGADTFSKVADAAADWVEQSYQRLADEARVTGEDADIYARRDGQTEMRGLVQQAAQNNARAVASYAKNEARNSTAGALGALWAEWVSRHDDRVRASHRELDGARVPYGGRFVVDGGRAYLRYPGDPEGPPSETMGCRCVPGDARIAPVGDLWSLVRFWWEGGLVDLVLRSGRILTGTPNHPVLTERGWVVLSECYPGEQLYAVDGLVSGDPDEKHSPHATVEEIFHTLALAGDPQRIRDAAFDFHGDRPVDQYVDAVWTERGLSVGGHPRFFEVRRKLGFAWVDAVLARGSECGERIERVPVVPVQVAASSGKCVGLHDAPHSDPFNHEMPSDGLSAHSEAASDRLLALARPVTPSRALPVCGFAHSAGVGAVVTTQFAPGAPHQPVQSRRAAPVPTADSPGGQPSVPVTQDSVASVRWRPWSGHVYSPSTSSGCYTDYSSRLLSQNCHLRFRFRPKETSLADV